MKKKTSEVTVDIMALKDSVVMTEFGSPVRMHQLWNKRTAIFVFLRHFGCTACRAHAMQVWEQRELYQKGGALIHFIGNGQPEMIKIFKEELKIKDALMFTDPTLEVFRAAGFRNGFLVSHGPRSIMNMTKLLKAGIRQSMPSKAAGSIWQLGGVLVVHPDGFVPYQYISEASGDFPPDTDIESIGAL